MHAVAWLCTALEQLLHDVLLAGVRLAIEQVRVDRLQKPTDPGAVSMLSTRAERGQKEISPSRRAHAALSARVGIPRLDKAISTLGIRILVLIFPRMRRRQHAVRMARAESKIRQS